MPWRYSQTTGQLTLNGHPVAVGYSGKGPGRNNPQLEQARNVGPIPRGHYRIGPAHAHAAKGPVTMNLTPVGHLAHHRTAFLIHGDSRSHPGDASEGCIILTPAIRRRIAASGDYVLEVVE
jgi:Protein of unknown function (DUF2778)